MKKTFAPVFLLLCVLLSCKKNAPPSVAPAPGILVLIDGVAETFNTQTIGVKQTYNGAYILDMQGLSGAAGTAEQIALSITSQTPITAGTYKYSVTSNNYSVAVGYVLASGTTYVNNAVTGANPLTIQITSISNTNVQGTFSGPLLLLNGSGASTKSLTKGTFNLSLQ